MGVRTASVNPRIAASSRVRRAQRVENLLVPWDRKKRLVRPRVEWPKPWRSGPLRRTRATASRSDAAS